MMEFIFHPGLLHVYNEYSGITYSLHVNNWTKCELHLIAPTFVMLILLLCCIHWLSIYKELVWILHMYLQYD